jgi:AbiV family abortive infection protein
MARTFPPLPPHDDLLALLQAALSNAKDLLGDAQVLADAGRFPRAFALATLAWEELSKGQLCALTVVMPEITAEDFWERFRDHEGKLSRVHMFASFMQAQPVGPVAEHAKKIMGQSKSTKELKERCLYMNYKRGKILLPSQVTERAARKQIKVVREALSFADVAFSARSLDDAFAQVNVLHGGLKNAMIANPDGTAAALQTALRGGTQEELQALVLKHAAIPTAPPEASSETSSLSGGDVAASVAISAL